MGTEPKPVDIEKIRNLRIVQSRTFLEQDRDGEVDLEVMPGFFIKQTIKDGKATAAGWSRKGPLRVFWMEIHGSQRCYVCVCDEQTGECSCVEVQCARYPKKEIK